MPSVVVECLHHDQICRWRNAVVVLSGSKLDTLAVLIALTPNAIAHTRVETAYGNRSDVSAVTVAICSDIASDIGSAIHFEGNRVSGEGEGVGALKLLWPCHCIVLCQDSRVPVRRLTEGLGDLLVTGPEARIENRDSDTTAINAVVVQVVRTDQRRILRVESVRGLSVSHALSQFLLGYFHNFGSGRHFRFTSLGGGPLRVA